MIGFPQFPTDILNYLFNLDQGKHVEMYCDRCAAVTDQVTVSYSDLPPLRQNEVERVMGRFLDVLPGVRLLAGKPVICTQCGAVNR